MEAHLSAIRDEFPLLSRCTYLNSNSTGAFPRGMRPVLLDYWRTLEGWRDSVWEEWWADLHAYADQIAAFIGGAPGSVVTDASMSSLLGRLGTCFDFRPPRNRIVITDAEFPTVAFIFRAFARYGAELVIVPSVGEWVDEEAVSAAIDDRTLLVCVSHATFARGQLLDVPRLARRAHDMGALIAVDAYQSVGAVPVDVGSLGVDFLLGGAHKWLCGSTESAFLYARPELIGQLEPAATGWVASADPLSFRDAFLWADSARRLATGTSQILPCLLSRVGLAIVQAVGIERIRERSLRSTRRILDLADEAGLSTVTPREDHRRAGIVSLCFPRDAEVAAELVRRGFICSHRGALRVAPHFYNTDDEVARFMDALLSLSGAA